MARNQSQSAIPLVLPNDYTWDEQTNTCRKKSRGIKRTRLDVIPKALDELRKIKGPVCVVSVAGPCRKGKSYVLSKVFDQGEVFPLGHSMTPETMGIWLWVVPQKFKDSTGQEFTVVLLDSEGSDTPNAKQEDDYGIFTLSVLLSSILIYNSGGVANRSDLENLDFIAKLSKRIQLHTSRKNVFPKFIWLLRDVVLCLPPGCTTIRDYFLKRVLNTKGEAGSSEEAIKAADSILNFFSGFDAFSLPSPAFDPEVVQNLNDKSLEVQINPKFLEGIEGFKAILHPKLAPKKAINEGEFVTGEGLAVMAELFVKAINTPGVVPNVECAWDSFVRKKCTDVLAMAVNIYKQEMTSRLKDKIPCDTDVIRKAHDKSVDVGLAAFRRETSAFSRKSFEKCQIDFREKTNAILSERIQENRRETEAYCTQVLKGLKQSMLDPVLKRLGGPESFKMQISDIEGAYNKLKESYTAKARGEKYTLATLFKKFYAELESEMKQKIDILQRMKDYNESLERQKAMAAAQRRKAEEKRARLERLKREKENREREMVLLQQKQEEEKKRFERKVIQHKTMSGREVKIGGNRVETYEYNSITHQEASCSYSYSYTSYSCSQTSFSCSNSYVQSSDSDSDSNSCTLQ